MRGSHFVILGDLNADPFDGDSTGAPAALLLASPSVNTNATPSSLGGPEDSVADGGANEAHLGDPAFDTADFSEPPGNIRVDYALPSANLSILDSAVFWPLADDPAAALIGPAGDGASDHRLVWVEVQPSVAPAGLHTSIEVSDDRGSVVLTISKADGQPITVEEIVGLRVELSSDLRMWQALDQLQIVPSGMTVEVRSIPVDRAQRFFRVSIR